MKKRVLKILFYIIGFIWLLITIYPLLFAIQTSLKGSTEFFSKLPWSMPSSLKIQNYVSVLTSEFPRYFLNSTIAALVSVCLIMLVASLTGFALAKRDFKFKKSFFFILLGGLYIPVHITLIPNFILVKNIGLYDTIWALIGPYVAFNLPVSIVIVTRFMEDIPDALIDSAKIDGCSWLGIYFRVAIPLSKSALITLAIYNSVMVWNEFVYALVLLSSSKSRTLPLGLWLFQGEYSLNVPVIMAATVLTVLPLLIIYAIFGERMISGLTAGAIKK